LGKGKKHSFGAGESRLRYLIYRRAIEEIRSEELHDEGPYSGGSAAEDAEPLDWDTPKVRKVEMLSSRLAGIKSCC